MVSENISKEITILIQCHGSINFAVELSIELFEEENILSAINENIEQIFDDEYIQEHIDPLADASVTLQFQFVCPKFCLNDQNGCHWTYRIKLIVQKKSRCFQDFFFQKMDLIQYTNDLLMLYSTDDFNLLLQLAF